MDFAVFFGVIIRNSCKKQSLSNRKTGSRFIPAPLPLPKKTVVSSLILHTKTCFGIATALFDRNPMRFDN